MTTTTRIVLVFLIIVLGALVVLPFVLNTIGVNIFQLGSGGGGFLKSNREESLLVSFDGGEWRSVSFVHDQKTSAPSRFFDISFHAKDKTIVFLGTKGNGLWKSVDAGKTWEKKFNQDRVLASDGDVYRVAVSASDPQKLYAAVYQNKRGRVLKSEDGGEIFREVYFVSKEGFGVFDVYVDPKNSEHVFIATGQGGVLETWDGGATWHVKHWFPGPVVRLIVSPRTTSEMYAFTDGGIIWRSVDGGTKWTDALQGFTQQNRSANRARESFPMRTSLFSFSQFGSDAVQFFPDPNSFSTVYLVYGGVVWRSPDAGTSWEEVGVIVPPNAGVISAFAVYPGRGYVLFAAAENQIYRSNDGGINWSATTLPLAGKITRLLIPEGGLDMMLAVVER